MVANYQNNDADDSGYESAGAMTDYSTDHNDEYSAYTDDTGYDDTVWHEYWDESAQAKYWYNEITVSTCFFFPPTTSQRPSFSFLVAFTLNIIAGRSILDQARVDAHQRK
jgi:hypothetical protein